LALFATVRLLTDGKALKQEQVRRPALRDNRFYSLRVNGLKSTKGSLSFFSFLFLKVMASFAVKSHG